MLVPWPSDTHESQQPQKGSKMNGINQARSPQTSERPTSADDTSSLDATVEKLYRTAVNSPGQAERAFQHTFNHLDADQQQQLAGRFVNSLGGSGLDTLAQTVGGQHALLCVYDHADCETRNFMTFVHDRQLESGNVAVDYTRSQSRQTQCIDPVEKSLSDRQSGGDGHAAGAYPAADEGTGSSQSPSSGLARMKQQIEAIRAEGNGVRLGGATVSTWDATIGVSGGDRSSGPASGSLTEYRALSESDDRWTLGEPCKDQEVGLFTGTLKFLGKAFGWAGSHGPQAGADLVCVDAGQVVKRISAEAVDGVLSNSGLPGNDTDAMGNNKNMINQASDSIIDPQ
jgi:hypothetical protein